MITRTAPSRRRSAGRMFVAVAVALAATACSANDGAARPPAAPADAMPAGHVHGLAIDPDDGALLIATHDGLYEVTGNAHARPIGQSVDLMGFAVAGAGHYLASGHPGPGVDLPQPLGLVSSTDGGKSWQVVSRDGESDFHTLTVTRDGVVVGFDGMLRRYADGSWQDLAIPAAPAALASSPDGSQLLATTVDGLLRSTDLGTSWSPVAQAPLLQVVDWADDTTVVGLEPSGAVWQSADAGGTWARQGQVTAAPDALETVRTDDGGLRIVVATPGQLQESRDGGRTFQVLLAL